MYEFRLKCHWNLFPSVRLTKNTTLHYDDVIMTMLASQITSLTVVYSIVYSGVNQRKHQSSASLAFVREIHRGPVNFPHKWPVTRKMFPFDDVIMSSDNGLVLAWRQAIIWTNDGIVNWSIYASLGLNVLTTLVPNYLEETTKYSHFKSFLALRLHRCPS